MKKTLSFLLIFCLLLSTSTNTPALAYSDNIPIKNHVEYINENLYIETIITDATPRNMPISIFATNRTITKTKTDYYKNRSGKVLWSVSVTGTFTYNGSTSKCTSCTHRTNVSSAQWSIKSSTSYKAANYATASATATYRSSTGATQDYIRTVTLQCDENGVVS